MAAIAKPGWGIRLIVLNSATEADKWLLSALRHPQIDYWCFRLVMLFEAYVSAHDW
jgi:isoprenylcysteine carboxyl methyltransferase (ICMT) family protein YpbQ